MRREKSKLTTLESNIEKAKDEKMGMTEEGREEKKRWIEAERRCMKPKDNNSFFQLYPYILPTHITTYLPYLFNPISIILPGFFILIQVLQM